MKTAISIPDELFEKAEAARKNLSLSRSELYRQAIEVFLEQSETKLFVEEYNRILAENPGAGKLDPVLEEMQFRSIPREEW